MCSSLNLQMVCMLRCVWSRKTVLFVANLNIQDTQCCHKCKQTHIRNSVFLLILVLLLFSLLSLFDLTRKRISCEKKNWEIYTSKGRSKSNWTIVEIDTEDIGFHAKTVLHTAGIIHKRTSYLIVLFDVRYVCAVMRSTMQKKNESISKSRICSKALSF